MAIVSHLAQIVDLEFMAYSGGLSRKNYPFPIYLCDLYDLAHAAGRDSQNPRDLAHAPWIGSARYADPAQPLATAGEELDDLQQ